MKLIILYSTVCLSSQSTYYSRRVFSNILEIKINKMSRIIYRNLLKEFIKSSPNKLQRNNNLFNHLKSLIYSNQYHLEDLSSITEFLKATRNHKVRIFLLYKCRLLIICCRSYLNVIIH